MDGVPRFTFREAVAEAFFHVGPHYVLGRRLDPFCLRHFLLLEKLGNPFVTGGVVAIQHIQEATLVCSTPTLEEFQVASTRRNLFWKFWWLFSRRSSVDQSTLLLQRYVEDYLPEFPMWVPPNSDNEGISGLLIAGFRCLAGLGYKKVMSMPLGEMIIWSMAGAEANGHHFDNIMKAGDIEALQEIAAEEAAKK